MDKTKMFSNRIPTKLRDDFKKRTIKEGHKIKYVLEKLLKYYITSGLPQDKI